MPIAAAIMLSGMAAGVGAQSPAMAQGSPGEGGVREGYTRVRAVRVAGLDAWGVTAWNENEIRVRLMDAPSGLIGAEERDMEVPVRTIGEILRGRPDGVLMDESALAEVGAAVRGWMLRTLGKDYGEQRTPTLTVQDGVATFTVEPPGPGVGEDGPHTVTGVRVEGLTGMGLTAEEILAVGAALTPVAGGLIGARAGLPTQTVALGAITPEHNARLYGSALRQIGGDVVQAYTARGIRGVRVAGRLDGGTLVLTVTEGIVGQVRSLGYREGKEVSENAGAHVRIRERSPVQAGQLVRIDALDEYVFRLNRQPGRRVDLALAPGDKTDELSLDFLVAENDPLFVYAQASNTGTPGSSDWRQRFGLVDTNLTGDDDIFSVDYTTALFDDINAVTVSYDRPLGGSEFWRGKVYATYVDYNAGEVGLFGDDFDGVTWGVGAEAAWNVWQDRAKFIDLVGGLQYEHNHVDNLALDSEASSPFLLPYFGARYEERTQRSDTFASLMLEYSIPGVVDEEDLDGLGRLDTDASFFILKADVTCSFFLEPLLQKNWGGAGSTLAHEMFLQARGQTAFGARLSPTFTDTVGGFFSVRGYPESFAIGDDTIVATAEYRLHVPRTFASGDPGTLLGEPFRWRPQQPLGRPDWDLILRAFIDAGHATQNDIQPGEMDNTLVGAGVGAEVSFKRNFSARVDWGFALHDADTGSERVTAGSSQVYLLFTVLF